MQTNNLLLRGLDGEVVIIGGLGKLAKRAQVFRSRSL
jgi:hypothetical protein